MPFLPMHREDDRDPTVKIDESFRRLKAERDALREENKRLRAELHASEMRADLYYRRLCTATLQQERFRAAH